MYGLHDYLSRWVTVDIGLVHPPHCNISNGAVHYFGMSSGPHLKMIGTHFEIIKDRQLFIFIKSFYMLDIPDNDNGDCGILIFSTFLAFTVLNLVNNYHVVLHILQTLEHFFSFSTLLDFLEVLIFCLHANFSEKSSHTNSLLIYS